MVISLRLPFLMLPLVFLTSLTCRLAALTVPEVFGDHMVLQADQPVPIWGWGTVGEAITVRFAGQEQRTTVSAKDGRWQVQLNPLTVSSIPGDLSIIGNETKIYHDVLVGEVWLCSGQSNMQKPLGSQRGQKPTDDYEAELAAADHPRIRFLKLKIARQLLPQTDVERRPRDKEDYPWTGWITCTPKSLDLVKFSAAGYYFGRKLERDLNVPIGLIDATAGGSRIEAWTTHAGFATVPSLANFTSAAPGTKVEGSELGTLYNGMIAPLVPMALKGFLWYQGESNVYNNDGLRYADKMRALITCWRGAWQREIPFYFVQLPPLLYFVTRPQVKSAEALPLLREAQTDTLKIPGTGMIVTTDLVTDLRDIHPTNKKPVGERLALVALEKTYGRADIDSSGPQFRNLRIEAGTAILAFDHTRNGLRTRDGKEPNSFVIAGEDGKFFPATAVVAGNTVIVSNPQVSHPQAVRFAWDEGACPNLCNGDGLPAVPFRTDNQIFPAPAPAPSEKPLTSP